MFLIRPSPTPLILTTPMLAKFAPSQPRKSLLFIWSSLIHPTTPDPLRLMRPLVQRVKWDLSAEFRTSTVAATVSVEHKL